MDPKSGSIGTNKKSYFKNNKKIKFYPKKPNLKKQEEDEINQLVESYSTVDKKEVKCFQDLPLSNKTLTGLKKAGYFNPTDIQKEAILFGLKGCDILGAAQTGSGKTLAFLIPLLEKLYKERWSPVDGLGAMVITPTRELAYQIFEVLKKIGEAHDFSAGLIIGGKDLKFETQRMDKCNIIICTPGRILQHMDENPLLEASNLQILVLDEADRILDMGFKKCMNAVIENLPPQRQTLLFSATQTRSVKDLARLSLKDPEYISVHEFSEYSTPVGLKQSYVICELHMKLDMLWSFIKSHKHQKLLVFFSTCKQVKHAYEAFCRMRPGVSVLALYGTLHQLRRMSVYDEFCRKQSVVLFATDIASRGLDFPLVNWVVQMDCPEDVSTYIHRAGRTARFENAGQALLVLLPTEERPMVEQMTERRIPIVQIHMNSSKFFTIQRKLEAICAKDVAMKETAKRAFVAYLKNVFLMKDKKIFDIYKIDTEAFSRSLGLAFPPRIRFLQKHEKMKAAKNAIHPDAITTNKVKNSTSNEKLQQESAVSSNKVREEFPSSSSASSSPSSDEDEVDHEDIKKRPVSKTSSAAGVAVVAPNLKGYQFNQADSSSDEEEDNFLTKKTINPSHELLLEEYENEDDFNLEKEKKVKVITRAAIAKKLLKKKILPNKKITFNEDGEEIETFPREQKSAVALELRQQMNAKGGEEGEAGINFTLAKQIMEEEDKVDKKLFRTRIKAKHREERLKLKQERQGRRGKAKNDEDVEEEDGYDGASNDDEDEDENDNDLSDLIDALPDPDKVYGKQKKMKTDSKQLQRFDDENPNQLMEETKSETKKRKMKKPKKDAIKKKPKYENKLTESEFALKSEEELALHLLRQ